MTHEGRTKRGAYRLVLPLPHYGSMTEHDITNGGRRRFVSTDQARNLRERADVQQMLDGLPVACALPYSIAERLEDERASWDELGEESQDPDGWDAA